MGLSALHRALRGIDAVSEAAGRVAGVLAVALVAVYCGFSLLGLLPFKAPENLDFRQAFFALALAPATALAQREALAPLVAHLPLGA